MQIGLMLRSGNNGGYGTSTPHRWTDLRELALLAEDIGIDTLAAPDHLLFRNAPPSVTLPEGETRGTWELFTLLTAVAAVTRRVTLLPFVACTSFRNPALLAKIVDSLDEVSGGRVQLGLGAGWHEPEYTAYGYPFDRRASRFEEALAIILPLLRGEAVTFKGQFYDVDNAILTPRGPRPDGPRIQIGARKPRMLGLAAKHAHAYNTDLLEHVEDTREVEELFATVDEACRKIGRDPATMEKTAGCAIGLDGWDRVPGGPTSALLTGTPAEIIERLAGYAAVGVQHFSIWLHPWTPQAVEQLAPIVEAAHQM